MTDCSSGLDYAPFPHKVKLVRMAIHFGEETYFDGVNITADEFYDRLSKTDVLPTTSAVTLGDIAKCLKEFEEEGYTDVLYFPLPFALSKATENLLLIKDEINPNIKLHIYNARTTTLLLGYIANEAQKMADKGYSIEAIIERTEKLRKNTVAFFVVDDLNHLVRSGRLKGITGFIGNLMKIKPILTLSEEGAVVPFSKIRTHRRALEEMSRIVNNKFANCEKVAYFILHSGKDKEAQAIKEAYVDNATNKYSFYMSTIPPILGVHVGKGLIGYGGYILDGIEEI